MRNKKVSDISGAGGGGAPTSNQPSPRRVVVQPSPRKSSLARELDFAANLGAEFFGLSDDEDQQSEYASPVNAGNQESVRLRVKLRVRLGVRLRLKLRLRLRVGLGLSRICSARLLSYLLVKHMQCIHSLSCINFYICIQHVYL